MKYKKIVLAGGNGYIGRVLAEYYREKAAEVVILSRHEKETLHNIRTVVWDGKTRGRWTAELVNADMLVNLCGKNVNCRYTPENKAEIIASRTVPTELLGEVIKDLFEPPKLWINVTSATIYRHADDRPQDEASGETGAGFSVEVCQAWEAAFDKYDTPHTRKINLRMGMVLGRDDSVFPRLLTLVKTGMGGMQGNGRQYVSWVHEHDVARITEWFITNPQAQGIFNCTAPEAVRNSELMRTIRSACGMPFGLPVPGWLLEAGALLIGTETELVLKSRWVVPKRLLDEGFEFTYPTVGEAVKASLDR
ncbi:TIGR01777 family oxidoreductase [soil metagenome]|jgi:uncharacterized protein (TIGR01777 family)